MKAHSLVLISICASLTGVVGFHWGRWPSASPAVVDRPSVAFVPSRTVHLKDPPLIITGLAVLAGMRPGEILALQWSTMLETISKSVNDSIRGNRHPQDPPFNPQSDTVSGSSIQVQTDGYFLPPVRGLPYPGTTAGDGTSGPGWNWWGLAGPTSRSCAVGIPPSCMN